MRQLLYHEFSLSAPRQVFSSPPDSCARVKCQRGACWERLSYVVESELIFERQTVIWRVFGIFGCGGARIILPPSRASEYTCATNYIEHRTTKTKHPWTNGQIERINRTIKDTTVKRFIMRAATDSASISTISYRPTIFTRRLKTLKGLAPYEFICKYWTKEPERCRFIPIHPCL